MDRVKHTGFWTLFAKGKIRAGHHNHVMVVKVDLRN